jgi:hypothetical protein
MKTRTLFLFACVLAMAALAMAADISGKWVAQVPGRDGQTREQTFTFKVDGDNLTGTMSGRQGQETPITEGKISGDTLSFKATAQFGGNSMTWNYTGKVAGNEIQMKRAGGRGEPREFTAKRAQ